MADSPDYAVDSATNGPVVPTAADELDLILDAAQQAWERGETLLTWLDRYPVYAAELGELALSLARLRLAPEPTTAESAAAGRSFLQAVDAVLGPAKQADDATSTSKRHCGNQ